MIKEFCGVGDHLFFQKNNLRHLCECDSRLRDQLNLPAFGYSLYSCLSVAWCELMLDDPVLLKTACLIDGE
ncbi:MAG: hypothetical protein PVF16_02660, partial [Chromatiales bacterium]